MKKYLSGFLVGIIALLSAAACGSGVSSISNYNPTAVAITGGTVDVSAYKLNGKPLVTGIAPTIASGFGTGPSLVWTNGSTVFNLQMGSGGVDSSGIITMGSAAPNAWACFLLNINNPGTTTSYVSASTTTTITISNITTATGVAVAWGAYTQVRAICFPM